MDETYSSARRDSARSRSAGLVSIICRYNSSRSAAGIVKRHDEFSNKARITFITSILSSALSADTSDRAWPGLTQWSIFGAKTFKIEITIHLLPFINTWWKRKSCSELFSPYISHIHFTIFHRIYFDQFIYYWVTEPPKLVGILLWCWRKIFRSDINYYWEVSSLTNLSIEESSCSVCRLACDLWDPGAYSCQDKRSIDLSVLHAAFRDHSSIT